MSAVLQPTSNISSRHTSMRQWPACGCWWDSSCRRIFSLCTRSLLYLGTVRHSASSGSCAGDRACWWFPGGPTCSFDGVGWLKRSMVWKWGWSYAVCGYLRVVHDSEYVWVCRNKVSCTELCTNSVFSLLGDLTVLRWPFYTVYAYVLQLVTFTWPQTYSPLS